MLGPQRKFGQWGDSGASVSELLPHHRDIVDDVCFIKSVKTDVFNHGPAKLFVQTGSPQPGRPSMGSWVTYGIGSEADDLPGFVVLQSGPRGPRGGSALWSSGFVPTTFQGVPFRGQGDPILNLESPPGFDRAGQRLFTDTVGDLNRLRYDAVRDPEIQTRMAAYEMAYKMQISAPELMDISKEPKPHPRHVRSQTRRCVIRKQCSVGEAAGTTWGSIYSALSHQLGSTRRCGVARERVARKVQAS